MSIKPQLSIGLPVFNGESYIRKTIESFLSQEFSDFELIVSDNASIDNTQAICLEYAEKDKRIKYYRSSVNQGAIWNFNNVFAESSGTYFMWASHDDYWHPQYIKCCLEVLKNSPSVILAGTACDCFDDANAKSLFIDQGVTTVGFKPQERYKLCKKIIYDPQSMSSIFYGIYRREALSKMVPLKRVFAIDHIVLAGLSLSGEFVCLPEVLMTKRGGGASVSLERTAKVIPIKNPFLIRYPHLVREIILQMIILKSGYLSFFSKIALSCWSLSDFFQRSLFNRTTMLRNKIRPQQV